MTWICEKEWRQKHAQPSKWRLQCWKLVFFVPKDDKCTTNALGIFPGLFLHTVVVVKITTWSDRLLSRDHSTLFNHCLSVLFSSSVIVTFSWWEFDPTKIITESFLAENNLGCDLIVVADWKKECGCCEIRDWTWIIWSFFLSLCLLWAYLCLCCCVEARHSAKKLHYSRRLT